VARQPFVRRRLALASLALLGVSVGACDAGTSPTPAITPGTAAAPREVNLIAKDYSFVPPVVDLVPGETVVLHLLNGGVLIHEAVFGGPAVQAAWEAAEAAVAGAPPGPTPRVTVPAAVRGLRVVAGSGQRVDSTWKVPLGEAVPAAGFVVGCHIPGHFAQGMVVPVRWVGTDGQPLSSVSPLPGSPSSAAPTP
jgi:uncharacterized cupredoxin-like copper-binding protein